MSLLESYLDYLLKEEDSEETSSDYIFRNPRKYLSNTTKYSAAGGAATGGSLGTLIGALVGKKGKKKKTAAIGALVGAGLGAGLGVGGDVATKKTVRTLRLRDRKMLRQYKSEKRKEQAKKREV